MSRIRLMGPGEVNAFLGISHQRVLLLRKRPEFPAPAAVLECGPIWLAEDIEAYAVVRNRKPGRPRKNRTEGTP